MKTKYAYVISNPCYRTDVWYNMKCNIPFAINFNFGSIINSNKPRTIFVFLNESEMCRGLISVVVIWEDTGLIGQGPCGCRYKQEEEEVRLSAWATGNTPSTIIAELNATHLLCSY